MDALRPIFSDNVYILCITVADNCKWGFMGLIPNSLRNKPQKKNQYKFEQIDAGNVWISYIL